MKRFRFTLEPVRRIREQEEQLIQIELASSFAVRAQIEERLNNSREAEKKMREHVRSGSLQSSELAHISRYDELHRQKIVDAMSQLAIQDQTIIRIRQRLAEARTKREALDKLREREETRHRVESLREEQAELDEIGTMRHARLGDSGLQGGRA